MKSFALAAALVFGLILVPAQNASAGVNLNLGVGVGVGFAGGGVTLTVGSPAFNQRYVPVGQAWVNEPYIYRQAVVDPLTGRVYVVQRIAYTRRLVVLYYDRLQGGYGYFDRLGNPIPWNNRYRW